MNMMYRTILGAALAALSAQAQQLHADTRPELDVAFTYTAQRGNTTGGNAFWMQGGNAQISSIMYRGLGVVADATATRVSRMNGTGVNLTLITTTFGPRYTITLPSHRSSSHQLQIFGEATGGIVNGLDSSFPSSAGVQSNAGGTAVQVGGGADLTVSRHVALRLIQVHWLRTWMPNAYTGSQNNVTAGAGVIVRIR